jgi:hypothetical protein
MQQHLRSNLGWNVEEAVVEVARVTAALTSGGHCKQQDAATFAINFQRNLEVAAVEVARMTNALTSEGHCKQQEVPTSENER